MFQNIPFYLISDFFSMDVNLALALTLADFIFQRYNAPQSYVIFLFHYSFRIQNSQLHLAYFRSLDFWSD